MAEYLNETHEIAQRTRRIETRLMKLCNHMGLDPTRDRDRVIVKSVNPTVLDLAGLDVSLGDLLDACRRSGITHTVMVECRGVHVANISLGDQNASTARVDEGNGAAAVGD